MEKNEPTSHRTVRMIFEASIFKDYQRAWPTETGPKGEKPDELSHTRRAMFQRLLETDDEFYIFYRSATIAATWLSILAVALIEEIAGTDDQDVVLDEQGAALAFFSRLANDLWAILELVEAGFELQARALARSYLEHVDVLICCIRDRELTREFVHGVKPEQANAFWHKNVSKNKAKAKVSKFISSIMGVEDSRIVDILREDAEIAGSSIHHPTMLAGLATAFGDPESEYDSYPVFPKPVAASAGTLRSILIHHFWFSFAMGMLPKSADGEWRALLRSDRIHLSKEFYRLQWVYSQMLGFLLDYDLMMKPVESDDATDE